MLISSISLSHILGFVVDISINWISMYFTNMLAYEGAILVHIAVPCIWLINCYWRWNSSLLVLGWQVHILVVFMGSVLPSSKILFRPCMPSVWGMLVYSDWTTIVTKRSSGVNFFPSSRCIRWVVTFRWLGILGTRCLICWSTYAEIFSVILWIPFTMGLPWFLGLCILVNIKVGGPW